MRIEVIEEVAITVGNADEGLDILPDSDGVIC
jgi:hypothetical protein